MIAVSDYTRRQAIEHLGIQDLTIHVVHSGLEQRWHEFADGFVELGKAKN